MQDLQENVIDRFDIKINVLLFRNVDDIILVFSYQKLTDRSLKDLIVITNV